MAESPEHLRSALHKAFGDEMNMYWSAWAHSALTSDELAALAEMGVRPQGNTRSVVLRTGSAGSDG